MVAQQIINKYRPVEFDEVIGHRPVLIGVTKACRGDNPPHNFLLSGPSGVGKTTIARILATEEYKAEILEVDAGQHSGIEDIRQILDGVQSFSFHGGGKRFVIFDEVHNLSKQAFNSLLKILEDPPEHLYFALVTTELSKIPETIRSRCYPINLRPLLDDHIVELLYFVCEAEGWTANKDTLILIRDAAKGSARMALTLLQSAHDLQSDDVPSAIGAVGSENPAAMTLVRLLMKPPCRWTDLRDVVVKVENYQFENLAIWMGRYLTGTLLNTTDTKQVAYLGTLLDELEVAQRNFDRKVGFIGALVRMVKAGLVRVDLYH